MELIKKHKAISLSELVFSITMETNDCSQLSAFIDQIWNIRGIKVQCAYSVQNVISVRISAGKDVLRTMNRFTDNINHLLNKLNK